MTLLTEIIPKGKKVLLQALNNAGFTTLEQCASAGDDLLKIRGIGKKAVDTLKEECFQRKWFWAKDQITISDYADMLATRHNLDNKTAKMVAHIFFWENARPMRRSWDTLW